MLQTPGAAKAAAAHAADEGETGKAKTEERGTAAKDAKKAREDAR